jgi:hypothetical protein
MAWVKQGRVFEVTGQAPWMAHHAALPTPDLIADDRLRLLFGARDGEERSRIGAADLDPVTAQLARLYEEPVLDLGAPGAFDEDGVMPSCVVVSGARRLLFYIGWSRAATAPYRLSIGLAVSGDGGATFERVDAGPVVGQQLGEPFLATAPCVIRDGGTWRMWYSSGTGWRRGDAVLEPTYEIRHRASEDGVRWHAADATCIAARVPTEALGRPWVIRDGERYRMWFSFRWTAGFRTDRSQSYRIGYAESADGLTWERKDDEAGIERSDDGWDAEMIEYSSVYDHRGARYMLYNGNGFGRTGIGRAVWE